MDVIVLGITWYRTFDVFVAAKRAGINSSLVSVMLRDGSTYFALALILNIADFVTLKTGLNSIVWLIVVINSVTMSRFILHLRVADMSHGDLGGNDLDDTLAFRTQRLNVDGAGTLDYMGGSIALERMEFAIPDRSSVNEEVLHA